MGANLSLQSTSLLERPHFWQLLSDGIVIRFLALSQGGGFNNQLRSQEAQSSSHDEFLLAKQQKLNGTSLLRSTFGALFWWGIPWRGPTQRRSVTKYLIAVLATAGSILVAEAASAATVYTSDPTLGDFASPSTTFATLSNFSAGDVSSPYATTFAGLSAGLRVYDGGSLTGLPPTNGWILATFSSPTSVIRVFPNIDHFGTAYDGYQYSIEGSNDLTTWTPLYDTLTVSGGSEPFTIGTFTGTAPVAVNNVLTPGAGPNGTVGYIADFSFGTAYKYYAFGASTEAVVGGNDLPELSGVAPGALVKTTGGGVPEPATWTLLLIAFSALGFMIRVKRREVAVA
jgi:hypothetical protein